MPPSSGTSQLYRFSHRAASLPLSLSPSLARGGLAPVVALGGGGPSAAVQHDDDDERWAAVMRSGGPEKAEEVTGSYHWQAGAGSKGLRRTTSWAAGTAGMRGVDLTKPQQAGGTSEKQDAQAVTIQAENTYESSDVAMSERTADGGDDSARGGGPSVQGHQASLPSAILAGTLDAPHTTPAISSSALQSNRRFPPRDPSRQIKRTTSLLPSPLTSHLNFPPRFTTAHSSATQDEARPAARAVSAPPSTGSSSRIEQAASRFFKIDTADSAPQISQTSIETRSLGMKGTEEGVMMQVDRTGGIKRTREGEDAAGQTAAIGEEAQTGAGEQESDGEPELKRARTAGNADEPKSQGDNIDSAVEMQEVKMDNEQVAAADGTTETSDIGESVAPDLSSSSVSQQANTPCMSASGASLHPIAEHPATPHTEHDSARSLERLPPIHDKENDHRVASQQRDVNMEQMDKADFRRDAELKALAIRRDDAQPPSGLVLGQKRTGEDGISGGTEQDAEHHAAKALATDKEDVKEATVDQHADTSQHESESNLDVKPEAPSSESIAATTIASNDLSRALPSQQTDALLRTISSSVPPTTSSTKANALALARSASLPLELPRLDPLKPLKLVWTQDQHATADSPAQQNEAPRPDRQLEFVKREDTAEEVEASKAFAQTRKRKCQADPTAVKAARAKLKRPFKSPVSSKNLLRSLASPAAEIKPTTTTEPLKDASDNTALPQVTADLPVAAQFATKRSLQPFRPPHNRTKETALHPQPAPDKAADLASLEREVRMLKQAVNLVRKPEEDARLAELVTQWREAGRTIVERLFTIIPRPEEDVEVKETYDRWGEEQADDSVMETDESAAAIKEDQQGEIKAEWTIGTMMLSLRVDPDLLGWSEDVCDWQEVL